MKVALIGYGKMGREVERVAVQRGHTISGKIDPEGHRHDTTLDFCLESGSGRRRH